MKNPEIIIRKILLHNGMKGFFKDMCADQIMHNLYPYFNKETQDKYFILKENITEAIT